MYMRPENPHFTGDPTALAVAARQYQRREKLAATGEILFARAEHYLNRAPEDHLTNPKMLEAMGLGALTTWHGSTLPLEIDGLSVPGGHRPFDVLRFADNNNIAVSNPYDAFIESTTSTRFVCAALAGKSQDDLMSILIVTTPRSEAVPDVAPLDPQELIASTPLALIRQDRLNGPTVLAPAHLGQQPNTDITLHLHMLSLEETDAFLAYESARLTSAMPTPE